MSADQPKTRFEPPPWEREAFDRFQQEQAAARNAEELEAALRQIREPGPVDTAQPPARPLENEEDLEPIAAPVSAQPLKPTNPELKAQIEAMLVQLRGEEPVVKAVNMPVVNIAMGIMTASGLFITIQAALLAIRSRSPEATVTMLGMTMSFIVFLVGVGFIGGAVLLFRKYHR